MSKIRESVFLVVFLAAWALLSACAGHAPTEAAPSGVLEAVSENGKTRQMSPRHPRTVPAFEKLTQQLKDLGYEGVGLQYESEPTLALSSKVFSDSRAAGRQIKLVYTGLQMAYDSRHQSFTIGGTASAEAILSFIQKKIPARSP